ncbi:MAG: DUF2141 domain-containing protein [Pontibacterium sp.]
MADNAEMLSIQVENIPSCKGAVMLAVYSDEQSFLSPQLAVSWQKIMLKNHKCPGAVIASLDLAYGQYAVTAFHDQNDNQRLDKNWLGFPKEPQGVTGGVRISFGPPSYKTSEVAFTKRNSQFSIRLE